MEKNNWLTKHADTLVIISSIIGSILWNNSQFNDLTREISNVKQDVAIVKTILMR